MLFVPFELFATGADLWWATWHALRQAGAPVRARPTPAMPIDAQPIAEWHRAATAMRAFLALVLLRIPMRLRSAGMEPAWLVEWYEGQPIDKACHVGFASIGSRCRVIAARQYAPLPNYLSLYTTSSEVEAGAAPRENWVCGPAERTDMAAYDSVGDYRVVPALRYAHLHRPESESPAEKDLLVLLPYSRQDARQILKCLLPALDGMKDHFRTVIIKAHHTMATELATDGIGRYPDGLEAPTVIWSDSPLPVLLPGARIVVTTNTSAALEALCRARPVIVVGRTAGLTNNPLENADRRMWQLAYDPVGLRQAVENWSPCHPLSLEERLALGTVIRDAYFEPTSEETMQAFLPHLDRIR